MPKTWAAESGCSQRDHRAVVLVLLGLCLCLPHLVQFLRPASPLPALTDGRLVWLETGATQGDGLYWQEGQAWRWADAFAALGLSAPAGVLPEPGDALLPAFRLSPGLPPQALAFPVPITPIFFQPIPINQASPALLMTIPGIGERLAAAIIDYRDSIGGIKDLAALKAVKGIGPKKAAIIVEHIRFD